MYTTSFRVVQSIYSLLRGFQQSVPYLIVGVQTFCFDQYTLCGVGIVRLMLAIKLLMVIVSCREGIGVVQSMLMPTTWSKQSVPYFFEGVQTFRLNYHTSCGVFNVHDRCQGCIVDVQAAMEFLTISTIGTCCRCTNLPLGPLHFMRSK